MAKQKKGGPSWSSIATGTAKGTAAAAAKGKQGDGEGAASTQSATPDKMEESVDIAATEYSTPRAVHSDVEAVAMDVWNAVVYESPEKNMICMNRILPDRGQLVCLSYNDYAAFLDVLEEMLRREKGFLNMAEGPLVFRKRVPVTTADYDVYCKMVRLPDLRYEASVEVFPLCNLGFRKRIVDYSRKHVFDSSLVTPPSDIDLGFVILREDQFEPAPAPVGTFTRLRETWTSAVPGGSSATAEANSAI